MMLAQRTALITGAASGIGRAIAISLSCRGCHLALADIDEAGLTQTADQVAVAGRRGARVTCHSLDVSDPAAVAAFPGVVTAAHAGVDVLVNNAGVALGGSFEQVSAADFEWLFAINFWGVVRMTRAFLPMLRSRDEARLVNLSSLFGLIAPPGQTAYAASKFAVRGFSESLRHELRHTPVGVTVVHPGGVATAIARNARAAKTLSAVEIARHQADAAAELTLSPAIAGETIVRAVERRRSRVLVGRDARLLSAVERLAPVSYWPLLERLRQRRTRAGA